MKNRLTNIFRIGLFPSLTAIAVLWSALTVRAALPYPTASTSVQLADDLNYANTNGGTFTVNLQPNTVFTNLFMYIAYVSSPKTVNLTIIGNGSTLNNVVYGLDFFNVFPGSSLTLEQMTLTNGYADGANGGAIFNDGGTLTISNCTLSGNGAADQFDPGSGGTYYLEGAGGAIFNSGTLIIYDSILSDNFGTGYSPLGGAIYNSGTLIIDNSILSNNSTAGVNFPGGGGIANFGTLTISHSILTNNDAGAGGGGGGIANAAAATVTVENSSKISGNLPDDVYNGGTLYLDSSSEIDILDGNSAVPVPSPRISLTTSNAVVISWAYPSTGWSLQQNSDLTANWVTSTNTVANDGTNNFIIATPSLDHLFFRLEF